MTGIFSLSYRKSATPSNANGVAELRYDTGKNTRGNPKMIFEILMGDWNISKF